jgi:hypothetical protein
LFCDTFQPPTTFRPTNHKLFFFDEDSIHLHTNKHLIQSTTQHRKHGRRCIMRTFTAFITISQHLQSLTKTTDPVDLPHHRKLHHGHCQRHCRRSQGHHQRHCLALRHHHQLPNMRPRRKANQNHAYEQSLRNPASYLRRDLVA